MSHHTYRIRSVRSGKQSASHAISRRRTAPYACRLRIDAERRVLHLDDGAEISFERCLLATAGRPRKFYVLDSDKSAYALRECVNTLSSLADFQSLNAAHAALGIEHATVVGGGFLGTEMALALARRGIKVSQVYAESAPLCRHLPIYLAEHIRERLVQAGVEPIAERLVTDVSPAVWVLVLQLGYPRAKA